jgi:hypothetical protein
LDGEEEDLLTGLRTPPEKCEEMLKYSILNGMEKE